MELSEKLRYWAQNEEMVNQWHTQHGKECVQAADELDALRERVRVLEGALRETLERIDNDMVARHPNAFPGVPSCITRIRAALSAKVQP